MIEINPPNFSIAYYKKTLFLAGSIEMGKAIDWQATVVTALADITGEIYNPRRKDWDSSWVQSIDNPQFYSQVDWELTHLDMCNKVLFNFVEDTKSPITLMELGLRVGLQPMDEYRQNLLVVCPKGFWRRGNVEIVCKRHKVCMIEELDLNLIKEWVSK